MKLPENYLRRTIRKELLKEEKYKDINEIAISLPVAGAAAVGAVGGLALLKKMFKNRAMLQLAFDFIKKSPQMFNLRSGTWVTLTQTITQKDILDWVNQDRRLPGGKIFKKRSRGNVFSTTLGSRSLEVFDSSKAREIFIDDENFQFDSPGQDIEYLKRIYRYVHNSKNNDNGGNVKFQLIDTLFYVMITIYNKKYSAEASSSRLSAESELTRIIGTKVSFTGKNRWESQEQYDRSLRHGSSRGPGRFLISLPESISNNLSAKQIIDIANVHVKYADNLVTNLYIPYENRTINMSDIESDIRELKHKFTLLRKVCSTGLLFVAPGASKTIPLFLKALSKAVASDQAMAVVVDKIINRIENSRLKEGSLKEVVKLVVSIALNAIA